MVDVAVHRARARAAEAGLTPRFEVATNGLFDEGRCRFVGDYFDTVVLSLDGPEAVHNRHRPRKGGRGSYDTVARNARLLAQMPVELCLRICVTQDTVGSLETITHWLCQTFRPSAIAFETLQPTPESEAAGLRPPDPWELAVRCVRASSLATSLGVTPVYAAASIEAVRHSFCPVGRDTLIVSPDGRVSACYLPQREWTKRGLDLNLGQLDGRGRMHLDPAALERVRNLTDSPPRCRHCLARWHCAGGCHVNHAYPECPDTYDAFCIQTRIITACRLLEELGGREAVQRLLDHRPALERLALHISDHLADWERSSQRSREAGGPCPSPQEKSAPGPRPVASYRCHPEVAWAVESVGLTLIRRDTGRRLALGYPEAALWELLSREVPLPRLTGMMAAIAGLELQAARAWVTETIGRWVQGGWLVQGRDDD